MIPYEELVIALQTWRAKQGLPVGQLSGALMPPPELSPPADDDLQRPRTVPPVAPPRAAMEAFGNVATPPPLEPAEDSLDVEDAGALVEEHQYENEGDDFAMAFGNMVAEDGGDSTMIGDAPERPTETSLEPEPPMPPPPNRNDDW